jgi:5-formyltetrahydrofolate cyclo-ligase
LNRQSNAIASARRAAKSARRALEPNTRLALSRVIAERVMRMHEFTACESLACYLPAQDEVDPSAIIERAWRMKKRVYAPVVEEHFGMHFVRLTAESELVKNQYGLWEPVAGSQISPRKIDLVITPVVAFDNYRHRIGMGSGYFDRRFAFLNHKSHWLRPKLLGLAFECQRVEKIKPNPWDIRLYRVISERR